MRDCCLGSFNETLWQFQAVFVTTESGETQHLFQTLTKWCLCVNWSTSWALHCHNGNMKKKKNTTVSSYHSERSIQGWIFHFSVGCAKNRNILKSRSRRGRPWIFSGQPGKCSSPGVFTETSGHLQQYLWWLKQRAILNQDTVFQTQTENCLRLNLKLCEKRKIAPLFKVNFCKISTYHQHHADRLHRKDRCVVCRLIGSGPNHCEACVSLHIVIYFQIICFHW